MTAVDFAIYCGGISIVAIATALVISLIKDAFR